jgi:hypothetical protein
MYLNKIDLIEKFYYFALNYNYNVIPFKFFKLTNKWDTENLGRVWTMKKI